MRGISSIQMNQKTVVEAVQEYLDKRWTGAKQRVVSIDKNLNDYSAVSFIVTCEEVVPPPEPDR